MSEETQGGAETTDTPEARILIVEDEDALRRSLAEGLRLEGFAVEEAYDLASAREKLTGLSAAYDIILLDLMLKGDNGEDLLEPLHYQLPSAQTLIISAVRREDVVLRCMKKGAVDFLEKPFTLDDCIGQIRRALNRRRGEAVDKADLQTENPTSGWVELTAPSDFEFLTRMQRFSQVLFSTHLPTDVAEDLRMIMEEMGRNAIEWGNRFDKTKQFRISYCFFKDRVVLKFEDEGEGFKPEAVPDPSKDPAGHLKSREKAGKRPGGYGVFLVQNVMDEVVYNERGNVCIMTKFLPQG